MSSPGVDIPFSAITTNTFGGSFWRFRVMAWVVGVMLLFLCVVAIPLQFAANKPALANVGFTIHGILYIMYLLSAADLWRRSRFTMGQLVALVCAGFLPGLAFVIEHLTVKRLAAEGYLSGPPQAEGAIRSAR